MLLCRLYLSAKIKLINFEFHLCSTLNASTTFSLSTSFYLHFVCDLLEIPFPKWPAMDLPACMHSSLAKFKMEKGVLGRQSNTHLVRRRRQNWNRNPNFKYDDWLLAWGVQVKVARHPVILILRLTAQLQVSSLHPEWNPSSNRTAPLILHGFMPALLDAKPKTRTKSHANSLQLALRGD